MIRKHGCARRHMLALAGVLGLGAAASEAATYRRPFRVGSNAMLPTLESGDGFMALVTTPFTEGLAERGDIIVHTGRGADSPFDNTPEVTVPPGHVFMLGENRDNPMDSRGTGPVPIADLLGVAEVIYWSLIPGRIGTWLR